MKERVKITSSRGKEGRKQKRKKVRVQGIVVIKGNQIISMKGSNKKGTKKSMVCLSCYASVKNSSGLHHFT